MKIHAIYAATLLVLAMAPLSASATLSQVYDDKGFDANAALDRLERSLDTTAAANPSPQDANTDTVRVRMGSAPVASGTIPPESIPPTGTQEQEPPGWGN